MSKLLFLALVGCTFQPAAVAPQALPDFGGKQDWAAPTDGDAAPAAEDAAPAADAGMPPGDLAMVTPPAGVGHGLGINLREVSYYAPDWLFADAVKSSVIGGTSYSSAVTTDADGWPTADCSFILWTDGIFTGTAGSYQISFTGQATIGGSFTISNQSWDAATNTTTADGALAGDGFTGIILTNTKRTAASAAGSGVTNVKVIKPGHTAADTFTSAIKQLVQKFDVIRFMDFTATNWSQQKHWSDRVPPTHATQFVDGAGQGYGWEGKGAAWEYAIQLANDTHRDAWINVPAQVDDDYIRQLALLFRDGGNGFAPLNPSLHLYVEFSNEVWNGGFSQAHENHDAAVAEVAAGGSPLNYDGLVDASGWQYAWRRVAKRAVDISTIFREVFGDAAMMTRVRPVLEWQQANAQGTAMAELTFLDNYYNNGDGAHVATPHPVSWYLYGGGGSAYYNPSGSVTLDSIWASGTMSPAAFAPVCQTDVDWTAAFGIKRIAYEGGPSFDKGSDDGVKAAAWGDARMNQTMLDHHTTWRANGGDLLVYFQSTGDYQWGFTHEVRQTATPKLQAIDTIRGAADPALSYGGPSIDASQPTLWNTWNDHPGNMQAGDWFAYTFRRDPGSYQLSAGFSTHGVAKLILTVDGMVVGSYDLPDTGGATQTTTPAPFTLAAGVHSVAIRAATGSFGVSQLTIL